MKSRFILTSNWLDFIENFVEELLLNFSLQKKAPGPFLVSGSRDKTVKLWDIGAGVCLFTLVRIFHFMNLIN